MGKHIVDLALKIKKNCEVNGIRVDITEDDIKIARLASLLHDVGHQPFSHALDKLIPDPHGKYSSAIVKSEFSYA
jgi:HD superfamily phosphohydrolase